MAKTQTRYVCQQCGRVSPREMGRCPSCGSYGTMIEEIVSTAPAAAASRTRGLSSAHSQPRRLAEIEGNAEDRLPLSMQEFARVLGGGIVPGSIVLVGGDPGIGKSTLTLQVAMEMSRQYKVLYVSGEESERQIKMRAVRLLQPEGEGEPALPEDLYLVTETNLDVILQHAAAVQPDLLIVDSIQTVYLPELESSAGSVTQVRECSSRLRELAKSGGMAVFVIGHVTKEGVIAGPRVLEHIVDTVLYLEGDRFLSFRLLRSVKNRFGATSEVGVFEMGERGMVEVPNPSEAFLAERLASAAGSAITVMMEGTRPLLVEIQGLTSPTSFGNPRRTPNGMDMNRLLLVTAVLTRRMGVRLGEQDVFVNVVGGLRISEPASDLAVAAAIFSSLRDQPVRADAVLLGEVGLSGELRWVGQMNQRLREAAKLGFKTAIIPRRVRRSEPLPEGMQILEARSLRDAIQQALVAEEGAHTRG
ncbi:DNA repair protein RadA [Levilinea saccharolytica]|uniref:DNA repair protein RadA n=1 Tax=Levilinea saccharolytica TaxID=229921 RepID=A0A0M9U340_9CHLR|nr:DNA repair protein RadA [Levilinea saccharolytica]KPL80896.1 DNA repair protein RadA [Levilinea saccharolytica]GAP19334.1 DNA repair protein RadA [Levilinea saccharolytica]